MTYVEAVDVALVRMCERERVRRHRRGLAVIVTVCGPFWGAVLWLLS